MSFIERIGRYLCNDFKKFGLKIYEIEQKICKEDPQLQMVQQHINQVKKEAQKFNRFKEIMPELQMTLQRCKEQEINLHIMQAKLQRVKRLIQDLYVADLTGNEREKSEIYYELSREKMLETKYMPEVVNNGEH